MKIKFKKNEMLLMMVYSCISFNYFINYTFIPFPSFLQTVIFVLLSSIVLIKIILLKMNWKYFIVTLLLLVMLCVVSFNSHEYTLLSLFIIIILANKVQNVETCVRVDFWIKVSLTSLTVILAKAGMIYDRILGDTLRHSYGFAHVNRLGALVLICLLEYLIIRYKRLKFYDALLTLFMAIIVMKLGSRTSCYTIFLLVIIEICILFIRKTGLFIKRELCIKISIFIMMFTIVGSLYCMFAYNPSNPIWSALDTLLTHRLYFAHKYWSDYGITLWGQMIEIINAGNVISYNKAYSALDACYPYIIIRFGIIIFLIIVLLYARLIKIANNNKRDDLLICLVLIVIFSFSEQQLINSDINFLSLYIGWAFWNSNRTKKHKRKLSIT